MTEASKRSRRIQPFQVMAILAQAQALQKAGRDIIHLEVGEPDFATPEPMTEAAVAAMRAGKTHYTPALGLPELREQIARYYQTRFGVSLPPERVVLTTGASGALMLLSAMTLNPGDGLMLADPGYPCNRHFAALFEAHGQLIPSGPEVEYQLTAESVAAHWNDQTRVVLVASPANPTGTVLSRQQMADIAQVCRDNGGQFWVDEIYQGINFGTQPETVLSVADDACVLNSFSKFFGMTGWRLGWTIVPEDKVTLMDTLAQNLYLAPPTPAQYAALAAFSPEVMTLLEERRQILEARRDYLLKALPELGFKVPVAPAGALYVYADVSELTHDSLSFCERLLQDTGVAITPGVDFGDYRSAEHIRIAFTTDIARLEEAVSRIKQWLES